ncbi:MAG: Nicotinate phosphoribosyltransferase [Pelotomaculum thermopropionicum]|uniref:nicotinate phosphoribosyltransferase n=1 Tax=Pelotomaculum thermopropionicum TaxID=110500 RepID=A0A117M3U8_9FIRM|nr:MAG: Nicotinate phosphoribosyltransferase [Pelotomaculum thermopropionicum]
MIDIYALGTRLIVCVDSPALGGVYKLVAKKNGPGYIPGLKISGNPEKVTTPGFKKLYRIINKHTGKAEGDCITNFNEDLHGLNRLKLFDPVHTWIYKFVTNFEAVELLEPVFINGKQVYELPST